VTRVPFVDVVAGVRADRDELLAAMTRVLDSGHYIGGPEVAGFEREFAALCAAPHAAAVRTGTDALLLALRALGVGPGHEVITAPNSFFATAEAISLAGATPVFADVNDATLTLDPAAAAARVGPRTKAIIPVHLYGQPAEIEPLRALGLPILEDACQAHGARDGGRRVGSLGDAAAFSFYPTKNLGAIGEGGAITAASAEVDARVRQLRDHGQREKHEHVVVGMNARLDALQCACLRVRLRRLELACATRRALAASYAEALAGIPGVRLPTERPSSEHVYHLYVVRVPDRERVRTRLGERGIDTAIHYPTPIHLQPAYAALGHKAGDFPVAERAAAQIVSLPMYPELGAEAVARVAAALREAVA
jgi:dTDP-4-amino-4,6-dideoxygalactose transaminase